MLRLDHHERTLRLHIFHQCVRDLAGKLLLELQPSGKYFHCPCKFAQTHYLSVRNVSDMRFPVKRQDMMLACRIKCNVSFYHHLAAVYRKRF